MKLSSCLCGYLLILGLFAVIRTGVGYISCYETVACEDKGNKAETSTDAKVVREAFSEYINCLINTPRRYREEACGDGGYYCIRITGKLGGKQLEIMDCASGPENCDFMKKMMPQNVKELHCETCQRAFCNHAPNDPKYLNQFALKDKRSKLQQNTSNTKNSGSCIYLSVFGFALMLGTFLL